MKWLVTLVQRLAAGPSGGLLSVAVHRALFLGIGLLLGYLGLDPLPAECVDPVLQPFEL